MQAEGDAEEWAGVTQVAEGGDSGLTVRLGHSEQVPVSTRSLQIGLLLLVQETFDAGLQAFQQEGIANITALKDQLLAAKHIQSKAIEARHAALMKRWSQLLANSATRKKKLLEAQSHFRKVWVGRAKPSWPSAQGRQTHLPFATLRPQLGTEAFCTGAWSRLIPRPVGHEAAIQEDPGQTGFTHTEGGREQGKKCGGLLEVELEKGAKPATCRFDSDTPRTHSPFLPRHASCPKMAPPALAPVLTWSPLLSGGGPLPDLCQKGFCLQQLV